MFQFYTRKPYNLVLLLGDNIYENGEIQLIREAFEIPFKDLLSANVKFRATLGNHDIRTNDGVDEIKYQPFHMDDRYFTFY